MLKKHCKFIYIAAGSQIFVQAVVLLPLLDKCIKRYCQAHLPSSFEVEKYMVMLQQLLQISGSPSHVANLDYLHLCS